MYAIHLCDINTNFDSVKLVDEVTHKLIQEQFENDDKFELEIKRYYFNGHQPIDRFAARIMTMMSVTNNMCPVFIDFNLVPYFNEAFMKQDMIIVYEEFMSTDYDSIFTMSGAMFLSNKPYNFDQIGVINMSSRDVNEYGLPLYRYDKAHLRYPTPYLSRVIQHECMGSIGLLMIELEKCWHSSSWDVPIDGLTSDPFPRSVNTEISIFDKMRVNSIIQARQISQHSNIRNKSLILKQLKA